MFEWLKKRRIQKLMVERAGYIAEHEMMKRTGTYYPVIINKMGQTQEKLRQLGWKSPEQIQAERLMNIMSAEKDRQFHRSMMDVISKANG
jgi:hypothetical protein